MIARLQPVLRIFAYSTRLTAAMAIALLYFAVTAQATPIFSDDFEYTITNSATYTVANTSQQIDTTKWVRATSGFNASRNGIVNENRTGESFSDPTGSQAWAGRYSSNTGVTTAYQQIGTLTAGQTITVSFDSVIDSYNNGSDINAYLVLFDGAGTRNSVESDLNNTAAALVRFTGTATNSYATYNFSYTVGDPVFDNNGAASGTSTTWLNTLLGKDIALRFKHTNDALVDNVSVSISVVPEPSSLALLAFGMIWLWLFRRKTV